MRFDRAGHVGGTARNKDHDFALHVLACQIVVVQFRDREPVADKRGAGFDILRRVRIHAEHGIVAEFHRLHFSIEEQIERTASLVNPDNVKIHGLPVTIDAGGLQTCGAELLSHVVGGFFEAAAAGGAAFEPVVRNKLNV